MKKVAVVGGGPGGLFAARIVDATCGDLCCTTIFEALDRLGGKIVSRSFESAPITYEAGVAEFYDYSRFSEDPVKEMIDEMGLETIQLTRSAVIVGNKVLRTGSDIRRKLGSTTALAINDFHNRCVSQCSVSDYYETYWRLDNSHPLTRRTFAEVLNEIPDETARRYIATAVHTDIAAEPHLTTALNGVKNVLMDNDDYMGLYAIAGGNQRLVDRLTATNSAKVRLKSIVLSVGRRENYRYNLTYSHDGKVKSETFDFIVLAVPNYWLPSVEFEGERLRKAMEKHIAHYDNPAHYLRVNALFKTPFWRKRLPGSYFIHDVFGGTCVYDEGARYEGMTEGSLGWLIAGTHALTLSNLDDEEVIRRAVNSLPTALAFGRDLLVEAKVQRWVASVNAVPGGNPAEELRLRHQPEPKEHPGVLTVGDYLFDSTVNGVYDSANFAAGIVMTELRRAHYAMPDDELVPSEANQGALGTGYHDEYAGNLTYEESFAEYFCEHYTTDLIKTIWGRKPPYKLLDVGSATGITLELFDKLGVEAWGVENSAHIHARTLPRWRERNLLGDVRALPFEDNSFDFVYDTCLCYLPEMDLDTAVLELFRVARTGVFFGGITSDMTREVIERHDLFRGVQSLMTTWEWSERFLKHGFRMAIAEAKVMKKAWRIECASNKDDFPWYPDAKTMRACFYTKPARETRRRPELVPAGSDDGFTRRMRVHGSAS
jgi:protoporphyrinogen oxidase/SAM-dependent methyltransferase